MMVFFGNPNITGWYNPPIYSKFHPGVEKTAIPIYKEIGYNPLIYSKFRPGFILKKTAHVTTTSEAGSLETATQVRTAAIR